MQRLATIESRNRHAAHPYIVQEEGFCGGRPRIKDSRISVRTIAELYRAGEPIEEIAATYPELKLSAIHDAISFYCDYRDQIDAEIEGNRLEKTLEANRATLGDDGVIRFETR